MLRKMNKLSEIIGKLSYDELNLIAKDLKEGNIERLINKRINHFEEGAEAICPVCHTTIANPDDDTFQITFGPSDLRKKATFCATDCLEYFIQKIKSTNRKKIEGLKDGTIGDNKDI